MKRVFFIFIFILITSSIVGKVFDIYYKKYWANPFEKLDAVFKDTSYRDIVFLGDSRVHVGINPYYIDSITKFNSYNIGIGGAPLNELYFLTQAWFNKHASPKIFVISIGYGSMLRYDDNFENPCYYFSYLNNEYVYKQFSDLKYHTTLFKYFPICKYSAYDEYNKTSILRSMKGDRFLKVGGINYKGFINNAYENSYKESQNTNSDSIDKPSNYRIQKGIGQFNSLIDLILKNKSKIVLVYPPDVNFSKSFYGIAFEKLGIEIEKIAARNNIDIWHFEKDSSFKKILFQDPRHLNIKGSIMYSQKIGLGLKQIITDSL